MISATISSIDIPFSALKWAFTQVDSLGAEFEAHVIEHTYPNGYVEYEAVFDKPEMIEGKTYYWTNTAGATSSRCWVGFRLVRVTDIPQWFYDESEEA